MDVLFYTAAPCKDWSLGAPAGGTKQCVQQDEGYSCTLKCDTGFYFHSVPEKSKGLVITCSPDVNDGIWLMTVDPFMNFTQAPDCVG